MQVHKPWLGALPEVTISGEIVVARETACSLPGRHDLSAFMGKEAGRATGLRTYVRGPVSALHQNAERFGANTQCQLLSNDHAPNLLD